LSADPARGLAHLIGSVPLPTTEQVFRRLGATLGPLLSRMPDGETGERRRWIYWQRTMLERHPAMEVDPDAGLLELRQWDGSLLRRTDLLRFRPGIDPDGVDFPTGYADAARESWTSSSGCAGRARSPRACGSRSACPRPCRAPSCT